MGKEKDIHILNIFYICCFLRSFNVLIINVFMSCLHFLHII